VELTPVAAGLADSRDLVVGGRVSVSQRCVDSGGTTVPVRTTSAPQGKLTDRSAIDCESHRLGEVHRLHRAGKAFEVRTRIRSSHACHFGQSDRVGDESTLSQGLREAFAVLFCSSDPRPFPFDGHQGVTDDGEPKP
jgi:hypothetical protein